VWGNSVAVNIFTATEAELMQSLEASRKAGGVWGQLAGREGADDVSMGAQGGEGGPEGTGWHGLASSRVVALLGECFRTLEGNPHFAHPGLRADAGGSTGARWPLAEGETPTTVLSLRTVQCLLLLLSLVTAQSYCSYCY